MSINYTNLIINNLGCNENEISINVRFSYENRDLQNIELNIDIYFSPSVYSSSAIIWLGGQRESVRKAKKSSCLAHCRCAQLAEGKVSRRVGNI